MDSFLSNLYKESMEKTAGAELKEFYDSLSVEQLEQVLGLTKVAVEGAATPEIPDDGPVKKYLDATEKAVAKKTTPAELPTASSTVAGTSSMESGKQLLQSSTGKPEPTTPFVPREIKTTDDPGLGSRDAESKTAAVTKHRDGAIITGVQTPKHFTPEQVAMFHRGMRAIVDEEERKGKVIGGKAKNSTVFDRLQSGPQDNKTAGIMNSLKRVGQLVGGGNIEALKKLKGARLDLYAKEGPAGEKLQALREAWKSSDQRAISKERNKVLGARAGLGLAGVGGTAAALHKGKDKNSTVFDRLEGKVAADLTLKKRESLSSSKFAIPAAKAKKIGVAGEIVGSSKGKYPIPDAVHARNALARVAQHGTPAEKAIVERKVHAKFPGIGEKSAEAVACADQVGRMMAKTAIVGPLTDLVNLGIPSMIGYHMGKNEGRLMAANKEPMDDRSIAAALLVPGALGYRYGKEKGYAAGKGNKSGAEKRAELLITALRAIKDAPEHVKHAAAKYIGERL